MHRPTPDSNQSDTSFSHATYWGNVEWAWFGVEKNTGLMSEKIPFPDFTRVDCGCPRIYPGVDPELYPRGRGRLRWLPESTPPSQNLPLFIVIIWSVFGSQNLPVNPRIYHPFQQLYLTLPASTPPRIYTPSSQNIYLLPFLQLYVNFLESTPQSLNMSPFCRNYEYIVENLPLAPRNEKYSGIA